MGHEVDRATTTLVASVVGHVSLMNCVLNKLKINLVHQYSAFRLCNYVSN